MVSPSQLTILPKTYLVNVFCKFTWRRKKKKTSHQLWFYEPLLAFLKLRKFLSTSLNLIFVSLTYYHLSNTARFLKYVWPFYNIVHWSVNKSGTDVNDYNKTSVTSIFSSKERHKRLRKRSRKKQAAKIFPFGSLIFFKCFQMFGFSVL